MKTKNIIHLLLFVVRIILTEATPAEDLSPVLIWGVKIKHQPILGSMKKEEFHNILLPLLNDHMLVTFAEKELTTNDFNCMNNKTHIPCFRHMRQIKQYAYFPRVEKPLATFHALTMASFTHFPSSYDLENTNIYCEPGTAHTIYLPNLQNEDRVAQIEMHDKYIMNVTRRTICSVVYLFMAGNNPMESFIPYMQRSSLRNTKGGNLLRSDRFNIYFTDLTIIDGSSTDNLNVSEIIAIASLDGKVEVTLSTINNKNITFDVDSLDGYYSIKRFKYDSHTFPAYDLLVPDKFSYYCAMYELKAGDVTMRWQNLQFELHSKPQKVMRFSPPWHCTGFFSVGIMMGVFVMIFILSITFCGVCWIMDVHTCDRYEDPKGKPLVIVVRE